MITTTAAIRPARNHDAPAIASLLRDAFPTPDEARLVELLTVRCRGWQLVAEIAENIVGHIAFSPISVEPSQNSTAIAPLGLGPLAVTPSWQRHGIGSALVRAGIDHCQRLGQSLVVVLGDPAFYVRFGFLPGSRYDLECEFGGGEAFQVLRLDDAPVPRGLVRYCAEFREIFASDQR
ncbi:MAG: N-acetyltransferase [Pirellulaceae bacterium]|nr:N-acetyltransferase [Pirellulaceae bacterium]